ncbi:MAG: hypothetical protein ABH829_01115 [archaeon]
MEEIKINSKERMLLIMYQRPFPVDYPYCRKGLTKTIQFLFYEKGKHNEENQVGEIMCTLDGNIAFIHGLHIKFKGRRCGQSFEFQVLKCLYGKYGVRRVIAAVSKVKRETEDFDASTFLHLKLGYRIVAYDGRLCYLELDTEGYEELMKDGIKEIGRKNIRRMKKEQTAAAERLKPENYFD